jgi:hypothetical protein
MQKISTQQIVLIVFVVLLISLLLKPEKTHAQPAAPAPPAMAQVGPGSPLPVYVVNAMPPVLPEGFTPGTSWKFTTWTIPSTLTFTATVQKTEGGWAFLTINADPPASSRWYFIPQMPGAWEPQ